MEDFKDPVCMMCYNHLMFGQGPHAAFNFRNTESPEFKYICNTCAAAGQCYCLVCQENRINQACLVRRRREQEKELVRDTIDLLASSEPPEAHHAPSEEDLDDMARFLIATACPDWAWSLQHVKLTTAPHCLPQSTTQHRLIAQ